jgi:hypothetical protein
MFLELKTNALPQIKPIYEKNCRVPQIAQC